MTNYIYANGCSYVVGAGLQDYTRQTAIHLLAEELNCEYFNNAIDGGSNQRIVRTTIDWLLENNDKWNEVLVLIGWTGVLRYETQQGKKWIQMKSYDGNPDELFSKYLDLILYLQLFLEANNIKHIFWNTFRQGLDPIGKRKYERLLKAKWNIINTKNWVTEGDESWEKYLKELEKEQDVRVGTKNKAGYYDDYHPNELGHKFWYEKLKNKAKELSYI